METSGKYKAVRFDHYGGLDVLHLDELPLPVPGKGEVLVKVKAAGINPGESAIREGLMAKRLPASFPSGQGSDFAGIIRKTGLGVTHLKEGDEVIGFTNNRASQAEYVVADARHLVRKPAHVSWEQAGALFVAGTTAYAAIRAVELKKGEALVISGAAGGVGSIAVQLAHNIGATVIGIAGEANHEWLSAHQVIPIEYGVGLEQRIRQAAGPGGRIDAFIDTYGHGYVDLALRLNVDPSRIDTIIDFEAAQKYHVRTEGNAAAARAEVLAQLAQLIEEGRLEIPIAATYPLTRVKDAYRELEKRHTRGKIVLVP
jgi:NADPH:quinone reductase-like Zn-dependent oxidoreductase